MTAEPIPTTVKRWKCPSCNRHHSSKRAAVEHIARCWYDPANRACKTCEHRIEPYYEPEVGINDEEGCDKGVEDEALPVTNCPMWEPRGAGDLS